jgi:hypothetical protein
MSTRAISKNHSAVNARARAPDRAHNRQNHFDWQMVNHPASVTSTRMNAIIPFVASLLICSFACNLSADTPQIRVNVQASGGNGDDARMVSALSREFSKLDGVSVIDTQPAIKIDCVIGRKFVLLSVKNVPIIYASSVAVTTFDGHLVTHLLLTHTTIDGLAHEIAVALDGKVIEPMRRAAQPSSSP